MKRSQNQEVKPYVPKRLRTKQSDEKKPQPSETTKSTKDSNTNFKHTKAVTKIKWHPSLDNKVATTSLDGKIIVWEVTSNNSLTSKQCFTEHHEGIKDLKWNTDGTSFLTASFDKTCKIRDLVTGVCKEDIKFDDLLTSAIYHPEDANIFLVGTLSSGIQAMDIREKKIIKKYKSFFGQVQDMMFLPDRTTFLSCEEAVKRNSLDKTIMAWDFKTGAVLSNQIYPEPYTCSSLKLHPNQRNFLAQSSAGYIAIFDTEKPWRLNRRKRFESHQVTGYKVDFDFDFTGCKLYSGDITGCVYTFDWFSSKVNKVQKIFDSPCVSLACHPKINSMLCVGSWEGDVKIIV